MRFQCILSGVDGHGIKRVKPYPHSGARTNVLSVTLTSAYNNQECNLFNNVVYKKNLQIKRCT